MAGGYGPPLLDFSPIGDLANTFFDARDRTRRRKLEDLQLQAGDEWSKAVASGLDAPPATPAAPSMSLSSLGQAQTGKLPAFAGGQTRPMTMPASPELAQAIKEHATAAGIDPVDLATAISYETAGTFDPWKAGPRTQWGQHRGLIQWGEPQAKQYGVYEGMPVKEQVAAAVKYLQDRGVKPGMGLMDVYSAINAGSVGRYNASDANNGGAPGTVADKVNNQMAGHRQKAMALLGVSPSDAPAPGARNAQFQIPGQAQAGAPASAQPPQIQIPAYIRQALQSQNPFVREQAAKAAQGYLKAQQDAQMKVWEHGLDQPNKDRTYNLERDKFDFERNKPVSVSPNASLVVPETGEVRYTAPAAPTGDMTEFAFSRANPEFTEWTRGNKKAGATVIDASQKAENKFDETLAGKQAERWNGYITGADEAQTRMADIEQMREASRRIGSQGSSANGKLLFGPYLEAAGINVAGLSDIQLYDSLVKRLAPQMRAPGSGGTSDVEYKGFVSAIGPLANNPAAREMILDTFEAASRNDLARGEIATRLANKEITRAQAEKELRSLPSPMQAFREFRKNNPDLVGDAIKAAHSTDKQPQPGTRPAPNPGDIQQGYRFKGGDPANPASWEKLQ